MRGEKDQIKFGFERWQVVGLMKARRRLSLAFGKVFMETQRSYLD